MSQHHRNGGWTAKHLRVWKPRIAATLPAPCVDCGNPVFPDQQWDIGHIIPVSAGGTPTADNLGPSHRHCNRSAGGRLGAAHTNSGHRTTSHHDPRYPQP
ncbi:HNH endonuclease signature motif containing protein [Curtobacterium sp. MCBD17_035]|uniref:HNH endonuclease n=1 Tax=Curtobacterium sp. MCBD17_035 TaxID=2175673 RepID=UPI0015E8AD41